MYNHEHIELSKMLRNQLEAKLDEVHKRTGFYEYFNNNERIKAAKDNEYLENLINPRLHDEKFERSVYAAIKTWINMCNDDRLLVLSKFCDYCKSKRLIFIQPDYHIAFTVFLIRELTGILSDIKWNAVRKTSLNLEV